MRGRGRSILLKQLRADAPPAAEFAPLLTLPQTAYLLPGDRIYGENLLALPAPGRTVRFDGGGTDAEWFSPPPPSGEVVLTAADQFLPCTAEGRFRVEFGSAPAVPASVKILLAAPEIVDAPKNRYAKLPATLAAKNVTAEVSLFSRAHGGTGRTGVRPRPGRVRRRAAEGRFRLCDPRSRAAPTSPNSPASILSPPNAENWSKTSTG